jgi:prolyl 4-hydroxylase
MKVTLPLEPLRDKLYPYRPPFMALVDDVLSADECAREIARMEKLGPDVATINAGGGRMVLNPNVRNNDRVIFDDVPFAAELFARLRPVIPESPKGVVGLGSFVDPDDEKARAVGLNERFRAYRYAPGQRFAPHHDGSFRRNEHEVSEITVIVYLNEAPDFTGGETAFLDLEYVVTPKRGMALLFAHPMLHEGCVVTSGRKYALRSDVMYRWPSEDVSSST